eukprot:COSAG01_NODE_1382_length_10521_cov_61.545001_10_plen_156_part_00
MRDLEPQSLQRRGFATGNAVAPVRPHQPRLGTGPFLPLPRPCPHGPACRGGACPGRFYGRASCTLCLFFDGNVPVAGGRSLRDSALKSYDSALLQAGLLLPCAIAQLTNPGSSHALQVLAYSALSTQIRVQRLTDRTYRIPSEFGALATGLLCCF